MKKIICLVLVGIMVLMTVACGSSSVAKEKTEVLYMEEDGTYDEYKLEAKGDVIHTITNTVKMDVSELSDTDIELVEAELKLQYGAIMGVTVDTSSADGELTIVVKMDVTSNTKIKAIVDAELLAVDDVENAESISLSKTVKALKDDGYKQK